MKIKVKDLAEKVDALCHKYNGDLFNFGCAGDDEYHVSIGDYIHATLNGDDTLEWSDEGIIYINDVAFHTHKLIHIKPED